MIIRPTKNAHQGQHTLTQKASVKRKTVFAISFLLAIALFLVVVSVFHVTLSVAKPANKMEHSAADPLKTGHLPRYTQQDSLRVVALLSEARHLPDTTNWMLHFGRALLGVPYVAHTLENNVGEQRLVINLHELDCTTFTENVLALSLCAHRRQTAFSSFTSLLDSIRYDQHLGFSGYPARLHYFTSWIIDNLQCGFLSKEVQRPNPPFTAVQTVSVNYMTTHPNRYTMLAENARWMNDIRRAERIITGKTYRYIPKSQLKNTHTLRQTVHDGDIIAIITNISGLDTQHIGIAVWHADGLHLLNASSIHKKVVEKPMTLQQYLYKHSSMPGIRVVRPNL